MPFLPTAAFPVDYRPDGRIRALAPVVWTGYHGDSVTIPTGMVSDLGTVPGLVRGVIPHDGKAARAFLVHDVLVEDVRGHQAALDLYAHRVTHLPGSQWGPRPVPPPFDAVDTDAVLRLVLAELGVGPVRWIYWEGVRAAALTSRARRRGFWRPRSLVPFVLLAVPALVVVLPAALGALVSHVLLLLAEFVVAPWEARARWKRAATVDRVYRVARGREVIARAGRYRCTCPPSDYGPGDHRPGCAEAESGESATRTEVSGPPPGPCRACRNGCPLLTGPCCPEPGCDPALVDEDTAPCPTHDAPRDCLCPTGNEAPAGGDCQHPTCPRDETPGGTL